MNKEKRIIIIGATSGIGQEVARIYVKLGWQVGIAGRRLDKLEAFKEIAPDRIQTQHIDVTSDDATSSLHQLIEKLGGMDLFFLSAGIGAQNRSLKEEIELNTIDTNVKGFTRMVIAAYHYFRQQEKGHLAVISSIAGTKGLGAAPSYSATKKYQSFYLEALAQLAHMEKASIIFTDIRPGFVRTNLLKGDTSYPLQMEPKKVAIKIVKALQKKKRKVIIDWRYTFLVFFWRLTPSSLWERLSIHT